VEKFVEGSRGRREYGFQVNGSYVFEEGEGRGSVKVYIRVYNFLAKAVLRLE
jgi:hypothetical protein